MPLPFVTSEVTGAIRGARESLPVLIVLTPVVVAALLGDRREGFSRGGAIAAAFLSAVAVFLAVQKTVDAMQAANTLDTLGIAASVGIGPWVLVTGALACLVGSALSLSTRVG